MKEAHGFANAPERPSPSLGRILLFALFGEFRELVVPTYILPAEKYLP